MGDSRTTIRDAARHLFTERGYAAVTVRQIAERAGVSPALVIKLHGSKAALYAEVGPADLRLTDLDVPLDHLARAMVLVVLNRRAQRAAEPWCALASGTRDAPDASTSAELREEALNVMVGLIGDSTPDRRHASAIVCHMMGFAEGLRTLELFPADQTETDHLVATFAPVVQAHIDACRTPTSGGR